jgi:GDP-L-fucose synthase
MNKNSKIFVAGHNGLVGSALVKKLKELGYTNLITKSHSELDLTSEMNTKIFFSLEHPEYVFDCAALVGGIQANNSRGADFMLNNLKIQNNIIECCHEFKTTKLLFLGSSCIYPRNSPQPIKEEYLLTSELEKTNEPYAIAKICGLKLCEYFGKQYNDNFISVMPTNLYGSSQDNYDLETSHVLPAMIRKIHDAKINNDKSVTLWGDGTPMREFLHVDDLAESLIFLMLNYNEMEPINIGTGKDISIFELAMKIKSVIDYNGLIEWNTTKPNGTLRKLLNVNKIHNLGWKHKIELDEGLKITYDRFLENTPKKL